MTHRAAAFGCFILWMGCAGTAQAQSMLVGAVLPTAARVFDISIPPQQVMRLGRMIWHNECRGSYSGLTSWNQGEEFASLGIGHFIWYPEGGQGPFKESFPMLLAYLQRQGAVLPDWLKGAPPCPWPDRAAFRRDTYSPRMIELRLLLSRTVQLQARFIVARLESALPRMLADLPEWEQARVRFQFSRMAEQSAGIYALVDYVNFKGEGLKPQESYRGEAWGLRQVLQNMNGTEPGQPALDEFAASADDVLTRRVENSPPERQETRWLPGWRLRINTYRLSFLGAANGPSRS
ncbi:MAG: hypothetical protein WC881_08675 [Elusimicrobiota bacterium]|jgi:hypothetical protein